MWCWRASSAMPGRSTEARRGSCFLTSCPAATIRESIQHHTTYRTRRPMGESLARPVSSRLIPRLAERHLHVHFLFAAIDGHGDIVAGAVLVHQVGEIALVLDRLPIDRDNQIATQHDR